MAKAKKTKDETTEKEEVKTSKKSFENDIIDFLKKTDGLDIDVGFMTETGANVSRWLNTGSYSWNWLSSGRLKGGLPYGKIIECFGDPYTGKSLLASHMAVMAQLDSAMIVYFDPERGVDEMTMTRLGGDPSTVIAPKKVRTIEQFNDTFNKIIERITELRKQGQDRPIVVVLDSLAMLSTKQEMTNPEKQDFTKQKKIRQFFRMYMDDCARLNILFFVINQIYEGMVMFGDPRIPTGGKGLTYAASQRYNLLSPVIEKESGATSDTLGTKVKAKTLKNRVSVPFRSAYIRSTYKSGVDKYGGLWELLTDGDGNKVTGFGILERVSKDAKGEWKPNKSGKVFIWRGVMVDDNGDEVSFTQDKFFELFKQKEDYYVDKIQEIIDTRNDTEVPDMSTLTKEERILAGIDDEVPDTKNGIREQIEALKNTDE